METLTKENIKSAFNSAGLPIDKIRKSKLGGFFVYHPFGPTYTYKKYTTIEKGEGYIKKLRENTAVKLNFIDNNEVLQMTIIEAKTRQKYQ
jgi:hypothetical protein